MKPVVKWFAITVGLGSLWWVTRVLAFYFFAMLAFFALAFQATVNELTRRIPDEPATRADGVRTAEMPRRLAEARAYGRQQEPSEEVEVVPL